MFIIKNNEVKDVLTNGNIITWFNKEALKEPRYYRLNGSNIEYSDNMIMWNKSNKKLESLCDKEMEWVVIKKI